MKRQFKNCLSISLLWPINIINPNYLLRPPSVGTIFPFAIQPLYSLQMVRYSIHNQLQSCKIIHHKPCFHVKTMKFKILLLINVIRAPNSLEKLSCDSFTQGLSRIAHDEWSSRGVDGRCCQPKKVIQGEIFVFKRTQN